MRHSAILQTLFLLFVTVFSAIELIDYNPVAASGAVVVSGNARFTVLTSRLIRIEYSSTGRFTDSATVAIVNRNLPVPQFTQSTNGGSLSIQTSEIALSYTVGQAFSASTLSVKTLNTNSAFSSWSYGQTNANSRNLLGTIRTLDGKGVTSLNCTQRDSSDHCEWGLVSRDGWALIDEKGSPLLDANYWWNGYNADDVDLYLFAHGHDYKGALYDFQLIGGKIIMVPKNMAGTMWSRWYNLADPDVKKIVDDYQTRFIPLDVFILDMDWHMKEDWTGYTFDSHLFPIPSQTMDWLHRQGLITSANLHDADGVGSWEKQYAAMATAVGMDPSTGKTVPLNLKNSTYAYALEDVVIQDLERQGMDFWWIDWQQGENGGQLDGGKQNPTIWTNHLRCTDRNRRGGDNRRAAVLARWGGLGNHRYQVGFSGDVAGLTWPNLAYQPYFSFTASNVGFGFWSHDIVGPPDDLELYTRWIQWGTMSGTYRTHDRGMAAGSCADTNSCAIVEIWKVPNNYFEANRKAVQLRAKLLPYIYTLHRVAFDSGVSPLRPMYYNYPQFDTAYAGDLNGNYAQYLLGDDLIIAPVVSHSAADTNMSPKTVWVPPGNWVELSTSVIHTGKSDGTTTLNKQYDLSEIPIFIRGGAIIPTVPVVPGDTIGVAGRQYTTLIFSIHPGGSGSDTTKVYEDDGRTTSYLDGKSFVWTTASYTRTVNGNSNTLTITVSSAGSYTGFPTSRRYQFHLVNSIPPTSVTANGANIPYAAAGGSSTWSYLGEDVTTLIDVGTVSTGSTLTVTVVSQNIVDSDYSGVKGGIQHAILAKANLDPDWSTPGSGDTGSAYTSDLSVLGNWLVQYAQDLTNFKAKIAGYPTALQNAITELTQNPDSDGSLVQLYSNDRTDSLLCGTNACMSSNTNYAKMRIEGYQAPSTDSNAIPWNDYWSDSLVDNWATSQSTTPSGYSNAVFKNGYIYKNAGTGRIPMQLWYSDARKDHLAVASAEGVQWAKDNGYTVINDANNPLGYVLQNSPRSEEGATRIQYSVALLQNANVVAK